MAVRGSKCSHREAWTEYVYLCSCTFVASKATKKLDMGANAVVEDKVAVKKLKWEEVEGVQRKTGHLRACQKGEDWQVERHWR